MSTIPFADNFLAGSLLTLLLPVCLLIVIAIWYVLGVMRLSGTDPSQAAPPPPPPPPARPPDSVPGEPRGSNG